VFSLPSQRSVCHQSSALGRPFFLPKERFRVSPNRKRIARWLAHTGPQNLQETEFFASLVCGTVLLGGPFDFSCGVTRPAWNGQANRRNKVIPLRDAPTYLAEWLPNGEWQKVDYAAHAVDDRTRDRQPSRSIRPYENSQSYEGFGPIVLAWASCVSYSHSTLIATCLLDCTLGPWSFPMVLQLR
jgi:hypothetical protein